MSKGKRRYRRALDAPEAMEELLERAGEDRFAKKRSPIPVAEWRLAVGVHIASRARPLAIERGVLIVKVATSVWANELAMLAPELVLRLKQRGYSIESLRFRVGALDMPERPPERRAYRKVPPPAPLEPSLRASIEKVADDDLRKTIENAARANLAWQSFVGNVIEEPRGARGPRGAEKESAPRDRTAGGSGGASRRNSEADRGRRR